MDLHKGKIDVYSEGEGKGSKFTVQIPMLRRAQPLPSPKNTDLPRRTSINTDLAILHSQSHNSAFLMRTARTSFSLSNLLPGSRRNSDGANCDLGDDILKFKGNVMKGNGNNVNHSSTGCLGSPGGSGSTISSGNDGHSVRAGDNGDNGSNGSNGQNGHNGHSKESVQYHGSKGGSKGSVRRTSGTAKIPRQPSRGSFSYSRTSFSKDTVDDSNFFARINVDTTYSYNLLIVDDSKLNRKMLCKVLRNAGHTCDEAEDGLEAIEKIKERMAINSTYDAVLMDFVMPNMDGPTATKEIYSLGYSGPIFGVTGNALASDVEYFTKCGAVKIFTKPLDLVEFTRYMQNSFRHIGVESGSKV